MPNLLLDARGKNLTENLFNKVLKELENGGTAQAGAAGWWSDHKAELVGLALVEVIDIFRTAQNKKSLAAKYEELVASMTWKEKINFLKQGVDTLKTANNKKLRSMALIGGLVEASPKIISLVLMVI